VTTLTSSRRRFVMGCSAAIAAMAGARVGSLAFADARAASGADETLVVLFLRGAWDALNVVPPIAGPDRGLYEEARPRIAIPTSGAYGALPLGAQFGLHPALAPLMDLYKAGHLAVVHAVGMNDDTRSHFDAQQFMEAGTPGLRATTSGWITRHLRALGHGSVLLPAVGTGGYVPMSLGDDPVAVAMTTPPAFTLPGDSSLAPLIHRVYHGDTWLHQAGQRALRGVDTVQRLGLKQYVPAKGVKYPDGDFGVALTTIAQLLKADVALRVATVDVGGWDTHEYQGDGGQGYLSDQLTPLAQGLAAFFTDLDKANLSGRVTVITMSEFGRRLDQNASGGTDHGHGSVMLALGRGSVNGGTVYGRWPGLRNDQLYDGADLAVTTDYRQVLGEILGQRLGNTRLDTVFPGFTMGKPLGIVRPRA